MGSPHVQIFHRAKFLASLPDPWFIRPGEVWQLGIFGVKLVEIASVFVCITSIMVGVNL